MSVTLCKHQMVVGACRKCAAEAAAPHWPKVPLLCAECGKECRPIAHNTGDGWMMTLDCDCQSINDRAHFAWPKGKDSYTPDELRAMGFEIV